VATCKWGSHLGEEVRGEQRQRPVLSTEAVVIRIEREMVQVEESASRQAKKVSAWAKQSAIHRMQGNLP